MARTKKTEVLENEAATTTAIEETEAPKKSKKAPAEKKCRKQYQMRVTVMFTDELLGTSPNDPEVYKGFLATKAGLTDEITAEEAAAIDNATKEERVDKELEKATTVFPKTAAGEPFIWDYQWKGYFKEKCSFLRKEAGTLSSGITAFKKIIDGNIFVKDRVNVIYMLANTVIDTLSRPLRAQTAQGEKISLANSETIPAGAICDFTIVVENPAYLELCKEWLDYGAIHGTGQWRNSGKGRFVARYGKIREQDYDPAFWAEVQKKHLKETRGVDADALLDAHIAELDEEDQ